MMNLEAIYLDVSELAPPEPMQTIISNLPLLSEQHYLQIKHSRKPVPLLAILDEQGFNWQFLSDDKREHWLWIWLAKCPLKPEQLSIPLCAKHLSPKHLSQNTCQTQQNKGN